MKTVGVGERTENIDQWNRIESPEIDSYKYSELIFDKGAKVIQCSKDFFFQQMVLEQLDTHMQKN